MPTNMSSTYSHSLMTLPLKVTYPFLPVHCHLSDDDGKACDF